VKGSLITAHGPATAAALLASCLLGCASLATADETSGGGFALRNQNPFLHIFGLPTFQSASLAEPERPAWNLSFDIANHADFGETDIENFSIDGETYFLTLSMRRRINDRLELGFDLPFVSHTDGVMDNMIEGWHDIFGMSNSKRQGPSNALAFLYQRDGEDIYRLDSPASGIGDLQLTAAVPLRENSDERTRLSVRASVKLPTGDSAKLLGSGGTDFAVGLYGATSTTMFGRRLDLSGFAGGLALGDSDLLPTLQRDAVAFGGGVATWHWFDRFALVTQLYGQTAYYDSDVEELGGSSMQLAVGAEIGLKRGGLLRLAVVEDVSANTTTDFALHFSVRIGGGEK
jgi:hypothetical protein